MMSATASSDAVSVSIKTSAGFDDSCGCIQPTQKPGVIRNKTRTITSGELSSKTAHAHITREESPWPRLLPRKQKPTHHIVQYRSQLDRRQGRCGSCKIVCRRFQSCHRRSEAPSSAGWDERSIRPWPQLRRLILSGRICLRCAGRAFCFASAICWKEHRPARGHHHLRTRQGA